MKFIPEYSQRALNGIYIIRNTVDNRVYIGECKNFYKSWAKLYYFIECNFIWYSKKFRKDKQCVILLVK